ncbi:MAG: glycogen/starch synthase, partial [Cyclobacteriaceae bacterium]|nr:glycogen/starch synthase [Cyclobacteriaceae bacterium]
QVYFIDNEDYFQRKFVFHSKGGKFFKDNDERAIFFCKGVLETVKKLGWAPDIVHCNDWMTSLIPMYLKTTYKNDPIFHNAKTVFTVYDTPFDHKFGVDLLRKVKMMDIDDDMLRPLGSKDYEGFIKLGIEYADATIKSESEFENGLNAVFASIEKNEEILIDTIEKDENFEESYYNLYNDLVG